MLEKTNFVIAEFGKRHHERLLIALPDHIYGILLILMNPPFNAVGFIALKKPTPKKWLIGLVRHTDRPFPFSLSPVRQNFLFCLAHSNLPDRLLLAHYRIADLCHNQKESSSDPIPIANQMACARIIGAMPNDLRRRIPDCNRVR
jgi:hypothetical protein